ELGVSRDTGDTGTNLAEILSNVLPLSADAKLKEKSSDSSNGCSEVSESSSTSSEISSSITNLSSSLINAATSTGTSKAPGSQLTHKPIPFQRHPTIGLELTNKLLAIEKDPTLDPIEREQRKQTLCFAYSNLSGAFFTGSDSVENVVALGSYRCTSKAVWNCPQTLSWVGRTNRLTLVWIPGHIGLRGNEVADSLARRGAASEFIRLEPVLGLYYSTARSVIRSWPEDHTLQYWWGLPGLAHSKRFMPSPLKARSKKLLELSRINLGALAGLYT
ncbi:hypothetical protein NQ315_006001, partial [Exocentrus adspersus]